VDVCSDKDLKAFLDEQNVEFDGLVIKIANTEYRKLL
jgi:hypothetical protein